MTHRRVPRAGRAAASNRVGFQNDSRAAFQVVEGMKSV
jgi:hypothetical protein